jgi:hypothetical protein
MANPQNPIPAASSGALRILPLRVRICLNIPCGLRPPEPAVPAIHPASKLAGILAKGLKIRFLLVIYDHISCVNARVCFY